MDNAIISQNIRTTQIYASWCLLCITCIPDCDGFFNMATIKMDRLVKATGHSNIADCRLTKFTKPIVKHTQYSAVQ